MVKAVGLPVGLRARMAGQRLEDGMRQVDGEWIHESGWWRRMKVPERR
jgi:hypothetical protein